MTVQGSHLAATYLLPIRRSDIDPDCDLPDYLEWLAQRVEVIVIDGSPPEVFEHHHRLWAPHSLHIAPLPEFRAANGKVSGVNTGLRRASHGRVVIGDDDVRYDDAGLRRLVSLLDHAEVVRPQNYFEPLPWHALWDTGRTLLNRAFGGDWPGTLAIRRSVIESYDGDVLFENLELCRTIEAAGGRHLVALDLYVRRQPPSTSHFWSQRVRQAYDEFARPPVLVAELALLPTILGLLATRRATILLAGALGVVALAEAGRRRGGGGRYFPAVASFFAPLWLSERAVCSWLAVWQRLRRGGVMYSGHLLRTAAHSTATLRETQHREGVSSAEALDSPRGSRSVSRFR